MEVSNLRAHHPVRYLIEIITWRLPGQYHDLRSHSDGRGAIGLGIEVVTHTHTQNAGQVPHWSLICWYFFKLGNPNFYPVLFCCCFFMFFFLIFLLCFFSRNQTPAFQGVYEMTPRFLREISGHGLSLSWQWYKGESSQRKGPPAMSHGPG